MIGIPDDFTDDEMWAELIATHMEQKFMSPRAYRRVCAKVRATEAAEAELKQARETIARLNRRCQRAESVADQNVEACRQQGVSFGRALAGYAARKYADELDAARQRIEALVVQVGKLEDGSREWQRLTFELVRAVVPDDAMISQSGAVKAAEKLRADLAAALVALAQAEVPHG
jgi:hypothetical protein